MSERGKAPGSSTFPLPLSSVKVELACLPEPATVEITATASATKPPRIMWGST